MKKMMMPAVSLAAPPAATAMPSAVVGAPRMEAAGRCLWARNSRQVKIWKTTSNVVRKGSMTFRTTDAITPVSGETGGLIVPDQDRQIASMPMQHLLSSLMACLTTLASTACA